MNTITSTQLETLREDFLQSFIDNMSVQDCVSMYIKI